MTAAYIGPQRRELAIKNPYFRSTHKLDLPMDCLPILAFDPGGTTGWSLLVLRKEIGGQDVFSWNLDQILSHKLSWEHGEIPTYGAEDEAVYQLSKLIEQWPTAAIVVEDFILRAERKEKSRELLSPVRLTAKLGVYLWRMRKRMFLQQAAQAKPVITNERMAMWRCLAEDGLPDHARDADRHALLFLRRCIGPKGVAVKRAAWPHLYVDIAINHDVHGMKVTE
jgi:hypothetical protein